MLRTYHQTKELYYSLLRMSKDDSFFVYFTFESNEGLCYYSTTDDSLKGQYRDIEVKCPIELRDDLKTLIQTLQTEIRLDVIEEKIIIDL